MPVTEILPYLLVIMVISLMVAPVIWMRPSPRQRRLAAIRQKALQLGLRPELRERPAELHGVEQRQVMAYVLAATDRSVAAAQRQCWVNRGGEWSGTLPVPPQLPRLPADVVLVELVGPLARAYWLEGGTPDDLAGIRSVLEELQAATDIPAVPADRARND